MFLKVVQFKDGMYAVRQWSIGVYLYLDYNGKSWWTIEYAKKYCTFACKEFAQFHLRDYLVSKNKTVDYGEPISTWTEREIN